MPQLVIKVAVPNSSSWLTIALIGEYDSNNVNVPRIGETLLFKNDSNDTTALLVIQIEYLYTNLLNNRRLSHIILYVERSSSIDIEKYKEKSPTKVISIT